MKQKEDFWFKFKVVASYLLLTCCAVGIVWFFYTQVVNLLASQDAQNEALVEKAKVMGNTLSMLYENESKGNNYIQSPSREHLDAYQNTLEEVHGLLDSLKAYRPSAGTLFTIKNLDTLLNLRENNIREIALRQEKLLQIAQNSSRSQSLDAIIPRNLRIRAGLDTARLRAVHTPAVLPRTRVRNEVIYDTIRPVAAPKEKLSLWQRLGRAIRGEEEVKEVLEVRRTKRLVTDTLVSVTPPPLPDTTQQAAAVRATRDTVVQAAQRHLAREARRREKDRLKLLAELDTLVTIGQGINTNINRAMEELQTQWFSGTVRTLEERRSLQEETQRAIYLAVGVLFVVILIFCILLLADINKSVRTRRRLEASRNEAQALTASRERLLLTISHDIKVPLSSLIGYLDLLRHPGKNGHTASRTGDYLESMTYSAEHIMELLSNLLEFYRLEAGKTELHISATPLRLLFEETVGIFAPIASKKGVLMSTDISIPQNLCFQTDSLHLKQILMNLLSNAVKYTDTGKIQVSATLTDLPDTGTDTPRTLLSFSVADTGCGISSDMQKLIFEEFSRIEPTHAPGKEGVGFGLSIVKSLVSLFEGNITVANNEDGGSTFTVSIPVQASEESYQATTETADVFEPAPDAPVWRILIVDDDPSQCRLTAELLRLSGHISFVADSLASSLKQIQQHPLDLVVTDIQLTDGTGFDLLREIRKQACYDRLPLVAITANSQYTAREFLDTGFARYLPKPFVAKQLAAIIEELSPGFTFPSFHLRRIFDMTEGDLEAISQIVHVFVTGARTALDTMQQALRDEDPATVRTAAHRILPMCKQLGLEAAVALEKLEMSIARVAPGTSPIVTDPLPIIKIQTPLLAQVAQVLPPALDDLEAWL